MTAWRGVLLALLSVLAIGAVRAHEVRPAMLEIRQMGPTDFSVLWKRPLMGDVGIHLVPHLSTGWLDRPADDRYSAGSFLIERWSVSAVHARALDHATLWVEGLRGTLIDVFVRIEIQGEHRIETIVRAEFPSYRFAGQEAAGSNHWAFLRLGAHHILTGPDHLLFVLGLLILARGGWTLIKTISGFTLAHSITLGIATLWHLDLPVSILNMLVALSILFLAWELNRARRGGTSITLRAPMVPAFAFGLLHGLAFATGLGAFDLTGVNLLGALIQFNVGVEIGQLTFVLAVIVLIRAMRPWKIHWPLASDIVPIYAIGIAGSAWLFQCGAAALEGM
jgi:hypothetical protein